MRCKHLAIVGTLLLVAPALAQPPAPPKVQITQVRVGFPAGKLYEDGDGDSTPLFRAGTWVPVYVELKAEAGGVKGNEGPIEIVVETADPDDIGTIYTVTETLPPPPGNLTYQILTYTKVAGSTPEVAVSLKHGGRSLGQTVKKPATGLDSGQPLYLTVGNRLPGFRSALRARNEKDTGNREEAGFLDKVRQMPAHWFAYQGVDTIVLSTGNFQGFVLDLASRDEKRRLDALIEWTQRGGHLVVCVGKNRAGVATIKELTRILPVDLVQRGEVKDLRLVWPGGDGQGEEAVTAKGGAIEVTGLKKKAGKDAPTYRELLKDSVTQEPLIVQAACGLGRVTVVGFDPDLKPFADWKGQNEFWSAFLRDTGIRPLAVVRDGVEPVYYDYNQPQELAGQLQSYLENFDEVPVISFGWVALFIFIYILVVGPLDYFFLKHVIKRLELTWITFPTVVLVVSAAAYFTAYHLKGNDLRVRKIDMVDIDLTNQQTYGSTWFTIFSPRIQHYTIGLEPAAPAWAGPRGGEEVDAPVVLSWMNRPEMDRRYGARARGSSLFRRSYDYERGAVGLKGVPIQVWSTKSFAASWQAPINGEQPLVAARLQRVKDANFPKGEVTWRPGAAAGDKVGDLVDAHLIYEGRAYPLALTSGTPFNLDAIARAGQSKDLRGWAGTIRGDKPSVTTYQGGYPERPALPDSHSLIKTASFHEALEVTRRNNGLRGLDQTWRQKYPDAAILVGRLAMQHGAAEEVTQGVASPSRLWLGSLPGGEAPRTPLVGMIRQETYVRVLIPVLPE